MRTIWIPALLISLVACGGETPHENLKPVEHYMSTWDDLEDKAGKVTLTDEEWRKRLTPEQYRICREKGTERAFTGAFHDSKKPGTYRCVACGHTLFTSSAKFDSGCGWPSFFKPADKSGIAYDRDTTLGMMRTEVTCSRCDSHLGHVFDDGPNPTGLRYCINSAALVLDPEKK